MKRVNVESGINIIINDNGRIPNKGFEVVKGRTFRDCKGATRLFKALLQDYRTVYMYDTRWGFKVEFKTYVNNLHEAIALRCEVEEKLEELEND